MATPLIWTNDDITNGRRDMLARMLDFLGHFEMPGTLFVVPRKYPALAPLTDDRPLVDLLASAMKAGHEAHQHSTTHHCEENGTADLRMYDLMGPAAKAYHATHRLPLERIWELDAITAQIDWGRRVWADAFGAGSTGFRPGCGAFCTNMYRACRNLGFNWVSSRLISYTGWRWSFGQHDYPVSWDGSGLASDVEGILEIPMIDDIAWRVSPGKFDAMVELGWQHWQKCVASGWPFILVSHPQMLEFEDNIGYRIHEQLLKRILATGQAVPMTLHRYYQGIKAGEYPMAPSAEAIPPASQIPTWHVLARN
jgi:peptidoglycan/xylan/chitin deacetylase (PgdA/CDA1 family)